MRRQIRERSSIREIFATLHNLPKNQSIYLGEATKGQQPSE